VLRLDTLAPVLGRVFFTVAVGVAESVEVVVSLTLEAANVKNERNTHQ
jgi:hypothetical protein